MADQKNAPNQLNIELPETVAEGEFANLAMISHTPEEFVMDFIRIMPNVPKGKVKARVIVTPQHAKRLMRAMVENVQRYEAQYGVINESNGGAGGNLPPMSFNTPTAQA